MSGFVNRELFRGTFISSFNLPVYSESGSLMSKYLVSLV